MKSSFLINFCKFRLQSSTDTAIYINDDWWAQILKIILSYFIIVDFISLEEIYLCKKPVGSYYFTPHPPPY